MSVFRGLPELESAATLAKHPIRKTEFDTKVSEIEGRLDDVEGDVSTLQGDVSGKMSIVGAATQGDFVAFDANGDAADSGKKATDFVAAYQGEANEGKFLGINAAGNVTPQTLPDSGVQTVTSDVGLVDNTDAANPKILRDTTKLDANTALASGGTKTKITYDTKGLVTGGDDLTASDIPDISATYQTVANRDTAIGTPASETNHYPTTKAVYDYGQAIVATIPSGGLKVPVSIALESSLPNSGQELGDYYFIQNMDVTADGHTGIAWWGSNSATDGWNKEVDQYLSPDGTTLELDENGRITVKTTWSDGRYVLKDTATSQTITGPIVFGTEPTLGTAKTSPVTNDGTKFATEAQVLAAAGSSFPVYNSTLTVGASVTSGTISHNLNTTYIASVIFINTTTNKPEVFDWTISSANAIAWGINSAIGTETTYRVIIIGVAA